MNPDDSIVISAKNLSKVYKLYNSPKDRLKEALNPQRKKYHKIFYALKDINLKIMRGEVIGIVGKNGSGKSTLLKILSRVLTPTSGEFLVKGKVSSLLELGSGFNPELTGIENIYFYGTILGLSENMINSKLQEILDFAEIGDFIYQPLKTYSSGMKSRLAFSVAINVNPDILILDEVLAVGDTLFRRKCFAKMEKFFKGSKTVLFVSHSMADINQLCTRVIMIDSGECICQGPAKIVTMQYERFLFCRIDEKEKLRSELLGMNYLDPKSIPNNKIERSNTKLIEDEKIELSKNKSNLVQSSSDTNSMQKPYFLAELKTKSWVEYKNYDVGIRDIGIQTLSGELVNVLISGDKYRFVYTTDFQLEAKDVTFGVMFKSEKGFILSGGTTHNFGISLKNIHKGQVYDICWTFHCNLLAGNYFVNVGVISLDENKKILNRIIDAFAFKVISIDSVKKNGIVNLMLKPQVSSSSTLF